MAATWTPKFEGTTDANTPLVNGRLETFAAGTLTPLATYTDQSGSVENSNPIILDAAGRANVWLTPGVKYKLVLRNPPILGQPGAVVWTQDNFSVADPQGLGNYITQLLADAGSTLIGWIQAGAQAVRRTVSAKLRDTVSVKDFGAVGLWDGVNNVVVDTLAIQKAIEFAHNANPNYFTITFPDGAYCIDGGLILRHGVTLRGNGPDSCQFVITNSSVNNGIFASVSIEDYTHIHGINFYYPNQVQAGEEEPPREYPWTIRSATTETGSYSSISFCRAQGAYNFINLLGATKVWMYDLDGWPMYQAILADYMLDGLTTHNVRFNGNFTNYTTTTKAAVFNTATCLRIKRVDQPIFTGFFCLGYSRGVVCEGGTPGGSANMVLFSNFGIDICRTPVEINNHQDGIFFSNGIITSTDSYFGVNGQPCSINGGAGFAQYVQFSNVSFRSFWESAVEARTNIKFIGCTFDNWNIRNINFNSPAAIFIKADNIAIQVDACQLNGSSRAFNRGINEDGTYTGYRVTINGMVERDFVAQSVYLPNGRLSVAGSEISGLRWQGALTSFARGNTIYVGTPPSFGAYLDGDRFSVAPVVVGQPKGFIYSAAAGGFISEGNL